MKIIIPLILLFPILISCNTYNGVKYELAFDDNASLKELSPKEMFNISAIDKLDSVFLIAGLEGCSACDKAKEDSLKFINKYHASIYLIDISKVTYASDYTDLDKEYDDTDYYYLYESTVYNNDGLEDINALPHPNKVKDLVVPTMLFFKSGFVGTKINQDFYKFLVKYVKVVESKVY